LEPDNTRGQARFLATGTTQAHAFCSAGDQDWVKFNATAGTTYRIETLNFLGGTDTVLYLYAPGGTTWLLWDDDSGGSLASLITFTPTASATYLLKAWDLGGRGGPGLTYDLSLAATEPPPNLLHNAGFEADTNGDTRPDAWTGNTKFTRSTTFAHTGTHAGRHRATGPPTTAGTRSPRR
jgi:hypothetical protein